MKILIPFLFITLLLSCKVISAPGQPQKPQVFALDLQVLEKSKRAIRAGDPSVMTAYKQLIRDADNKAMQFGPVSVMEKKNAPPSGDMHDYMSLGPYWWPDPSKPDGLPYIRKDGQTNPEVREYKDKDYMPKLCEYVHLLGLAYYFSEENKYAEHAAKLLRVWFLDPATKMNPNLNYGQAIKGINEGRGAGLIDSRHFILAIDAIGLIKDSKYWNGKDQAGMQQWFAAYLDWMQTSKNGLSEMHAKNNHGVWYDAQRLSMALFIDSIDLAKKVVKNAAGRLDQQLDENGFFPEEMTRTISLHYTTFVMEAFFKIAQMSAQTGIDFWHATTPSGKSLKRAFEVLQPYLVNQKKWEGPQIKNFDEEEGYPLLLQGATHFNCKNCEEAVTALAGDKAPRLLVRLLY